ncbi:hypothetical protein THAOC_05281, partial [Thalassiosira oceanica]
GKEMGVVGRVGASRSPRNPCYASDLDQRLRGGGGGATRWAPNEQDKNGPGAVRSSSTSPRLLLPLPQACVVEASGGGGSAPDWLQTRLAPD